MILIKVSYPVTMEVEERIRSRWKRCHENHEPFIHGPELEVSEIGIHGPEALEIGVAEMQLSDPSAA